MSGLDTRRKNSRNPGIDKKDWGQIFDCFYEEVETLVITKSRPRPFIGGHSSPGRDTFDLVCRKARRNARSMAKSRSAFTENNDSIKTRKLCEWSSQIVHTAQSHTPHRPAKVETPKTEKPIEIKIGAPGPFDIYSRLGSDFDRRHQWFHDMSNHKTTMAAVKGTRGGRPQFKGHTGGKIAV